MATVNTPSSPGSLFASPVDDNNLAQLTRVGPRDSAGLPTGTDYIDSLVTKAYELVARPQLRRQLMIAESVTVRPTMQSHIGASVQLNVVDDLDDDPSTAALLEAYDVLPTPLKSYNLSIALNEWGRTNTRTALARGTSMIPLDPTAAERVGRNAGATLERRAFNVAIAAGGMKKDGTSGSTPVSQTVTGKPSDTLRKANEYFQTNDVEPYDNGRYRAYISPVNATALRQESDASGWRYWNINQDPGGGTGNIANGFIGTYENFDIMVSSLPSLAVANSGPGGLFMGKDGLAKVCSAAPGYGDMPQIVVAPVIDRLKRFVSVGWFFLGDFGRFRAEAICTGNLAG
jgi:hypothetical protein